MATYSLSYNTADNADFEFAGKLHTILENWGQCNKYIITHEHMDQTEQKKDHLQCAISIDGSMAPSAVTTHLKNNGLKAVVWKKPAYFIKRHKEDLRFIYGYCSKELHYPTPTGRVLFSKNVPYSDYEFWLEHHEKTTIIIPIHEQWIDFVKNNEFINVWHRAHGTYDQHILNTFDIYYNRFIATADVFPTFSDRNRFRYNFVGLMQRFNRPIHHNGHT